MLDDSIGTGEGIHSRPPTRYKEANEMADEQKLSDEEILTTGTGASRSRFETADADGDDQDTDTDGTDTDTDAEDPS
jgi:hypothetical protein